MGEVFENSIIKEIINRYKFIWSIDYAMGLLEWDMETYMPKEGIIERSIANRHLSVLEHRLLLDPELVSLVEKAKSIETLNDYEKGVVRVLDREITKAKKIPESLIAELREVTIRAHEAWVTSREKNDFSIFKPYLEKIVELEKRMADYLGYVEHPYDALIDYYEEGWTTKDVERMYDSIIPELKSILEKVMSDSRYPKCHYLESYKYDITKAVEINNRLLDILGFPRTRARIDVSEHPFTINFGIRDARITTRYEGYDIKRTIYSAVHEFGHATYELQIDESLSGTPLARGVSMGIHESQSRFWENVVGRNFAFTKIVGSLIREYFPELKNFSDEDIYYYINTVKPSLIRVDADELTYNFHVALRFRIEKMLIGNEIKVSDVPDIWNNTMEEYLGIRPKDYKSGVLQDIHWSQGSIGYFPTYSLGTIISAQVGYAIEKDLGKKLGDIIDSRNFAEIKEWLKRKIHRFGATYAPKELI
ncbi:MAG: carboxypeptidase M32, partial [Fervidicoccus fontis]